MTNLLTETKAAIKDSGHKPADIVFIGSSDAEYRCTWAEFQKVANVQYDSGYGAQEVATDLVIRFSDGKSMWRHEYDGSEYWEYDPPANVDYSKPGKPITVLAGNYWPSMAALHDPSDTHHMAGSR